MGMQASGGTQQGMVKVDKVRSQAGVKDLCANYFKALTCYPWEHRTFQYLFHKDTILANRLDFTAKMVLLFLHLESLNP